MVDLEGWSGSGSTHAFEQFRQHLAGHFADENGDDYRLFRSPGNHLHPATIWRICAGIDEGNGYRRRPLIAGKLEARMRAGSSMAQLRWDFTLRLALNPTRWLAQQPLSLERAPLTERSAPASRMFHRGEQNYTMHEIGLVRGDNVHIGLPRMLSLARPEVWMVQVERYINGVIDVLRRTLLLAANEGGSFMLDVQDAPSITLKEIEAYWEFWTTRPLEDMRRIADPVRRMSASSTTAWFPLSPEAQAALSQAGAIEVGADDNSPRVLMRAGAGCDIRIYAKTDRRLRFEVAYDCAESGDTFRPRDGITIQQLLDRLAHARVQGCLKLNEFLGFIRPQITVPEQERQVHELFAEIFRCASTPAKASAIVSMLVTNGRIVTGRDFSIGLIEMRRLTRRRVLRRGGLQGNDYTWVVTSRFEAALARLRTDPTAS